MVLWRSSLASFLRLFGAYTALALTVACGGTSDDVSSPSKSHSPPRYALFVARTMGVEGTPSVDSTLIDSGQVVSYSFHPSSGYLPLTTLLDGREVASVGSVAMNAQHSIAVGTSLIPIGSSADSQAARLVRSITTTFDPARSETDLIAAFDGVVRGLSVSDAAASLRSIRALAYDSTLSEDALASIDRRLAGSVFSDSISQGNTGAATTNSRATAGLANTVPLRVMFVNGINTSPADFAEDYAIFRLSLFETPPNIPNYSSAPLRVGAYYVQSLGLPPILSTSRYVCWLEFLRIAREQNSPPPIRCARLSRRGWMC